MTLPFSYTHGNPCLAGIYGWKAFLLLTGCLQGLALKYRTVHMGVRAHAQGGVWSATHWQGIAVLRAAPWLPFPVAELSDYIAGLFKYDTSACAHHMRVLLQGASIAMGLGVLLQGSCPALTHSCLQSVDHMRCPRHALLPFQEGSASRACRH